MLALVVFLSVGGAVGLGLPGSGQVRISVSMVGGPTDLSGNSLRATVGHVQIQQLGRTVRTLTTFPGQQGKATLRPGLYQFVVTNFPGCGATRVVLWEQTKLVDIRCSVP